MAASRQSNAVTTRPQQGQVQAPDNREAMKSFRNELDTMTAQFAPMLPVHIPADRFGRVVMNAINRTPSLLACDRRTLWNACMQAAEDGLLPDGREGAIVPFNSDGDEDSNKGKKAQWVPMVGGIRKKVRNSGLIADWRCEVVYQGDEFAFQLGDDPHIHHIPSQSAEAKRSNEGVTHVYSIVTFKDGTKSREVMSRGAILQIMSKSRAKKGPWSDPVFFPEMAKKTVAKLHAKQLPTDRDLDRVLRRDDALYEFSAEHKAAQVGHERPTIAGGTRAALEHFAANAGPVTETQQSGQVAAATGKPAEEGSGETDEDAGDDQPSNGRQTSQEVQAEPPTTPEAYIAYAREWAKATPDQAKRKARWHNEQDMRLRLEPLLSSEQVKSLKAEVVGGDSV